MSNERMVHRLLAECLAAKKRGHDVFFEYSPHVDGISVRAHIGGWHAKSFPTWSETVYLDSSDPYLDAVIAKIKETCP